jgi:hypothetical protein
MEALAPRHTLFQRLNRFWMLSAREMRLRVDPGSVNDLRALARGFAFVSLPLPTAGPTGTDFFFLPFSSSA